MTNQFDIGIPAGSHGVLYGLWEPVSARFAFVIRDKTQAQSLKLLASGRYSLFLTEVSAAANYYHNIIDNHCCHNWTLSNRPDIMTALLGESGVITPVSQLVPSERTEIWAEIYEMQYLQMCLRWLKFLEYIKNISWYTFDRFIDRLYHDLPWDKSSNVFDKIFDLETNIMRILHAAKQNDTIQQDCEQAIGQSHILIRKIYANYDRSTVSNSETK